MNGRVAAIVDTYLGASVDWPFDVGRQTRTGELADFFEGSLVCGAIGDAMGRSMEGRSASAIQAHWGEDGPIAYERWPGWRDGPIGTITDDTQLTMAVAENLIVGRGSVDLDDFPSRLVQWLPVARGEGRATRTAIQRIAAGLPWDEAAAEIQSAGNGAAMRAAPIGLVHAFDATPAELMRDAVLLSIPTHTHPVGVAGAAALASGVAYLVRARAVGTERLDRNDLIGFVASVADAIAPEAVDERRHGGYMSRQCAGSSLGSPSSERWWPCSGRHRLRRARSRKVRPKRRRVRSNVSATLWGKTVED